MNWQTCTEETYPDTNLMERTMVSYILNGERHYNSFKDCPYGWGTLCKIEGACFYIIPEPPKELDK
jgi:hypothetical protein